MKVLVHGKNGYVVVARMNEENKVVVTQYEQEHLPFEIGENKAESTIPNVMHIVSRLLKSLPAGEHTIACMANVANKINSDILVKEYRSGKVLSTKRQLIPDELAIYANLIKGIRKTYGDVLIQSEEYISHSIKPGQTAEQVEWANLYIAGKGAIDAITKPAPTVAGGGFSTLEDEPDEEALVF